MLRQLTLSQGKRLFVKDMAYYLVPPHGKPAAIAPSLARIERGVGTSAPYTNGTGAAHKAPYPYHTMPEANNPTVIPEETLKRFHFTFLIRHPRSSIPSYYRCTVPPLDKVTGWYNFMPSEAGYDELRRLFDYLRSIRHIGPGIAAQEVNGSGCDSNNHVVNGHGVNGFHCSNGSDTTTKSSNKVDICVVDADDLLDNPSGIIEAYCKSTGLKYDAKMLDWDSEEDHKRAEEAFEKWCGWHDDAKHSSALKPRLHVSPGLKEPQYSIDSADFRRCKKKKVPLVEDEDREWTKNFGEKAAKVIRDTVDANVEDYEYLKQFALKA